MSLPVIAWARYHLLGRKKRARTLVNLVILISFLGFLLLRNARRSSSSSRFTFDVPTSVTDFVLLQSNDKKQRILPMTESTLMADWIYDTPTGSFWLPRPPKNPISGYESRMEGNTFRTDYFKGRSGFMHPDKIDIMMAQSTGFNAGDFYALWIAPMVSGRKANLPGDRSSNRCSLSVVGSILEWGIRYVWGPGFISSQKKLAVDTEKVFALRGPDSYKIAMSTKSSDAQTISHVYGDPGLFMSWYYQPHNQIKAHSLCLIPHYADSSSPVVRSIMANWNGSHLIDIRAPLFDIMDEIVKCEFVLSSSLHGIIFSDSYGIPNAHINLSSRVTGGDYKFNDYFRAMNRWRIPLGLVNRTSIDMTTVERFIKTRQPPPKNILPLWENAPMHAEAYNRTRVEHLQFARDYAKTFTDTLKTSKTSKDFLIRMGIDH